MCPLSGSVSAGYKEAFVWGGIRPSPMEFGYRNKMEYSFGDAEKDGPLTLGLHRRGSIYDVLNNILDHIALQIDEEQ